jgi:hypothetical protein
MNILPYLTEPILPTEVKQIFLFPYTVILPKDLQLTEQKLMYRDQSEQTNLEVAKEKMM